MLWRNVANVRTRHSLRVPAFVTVIWILSGSLPCAATTDFTAAGALLIAQEGESAFILLGKDRYRSWYEMFAGRRETVLDGNEQGKSRPETAYQTALRECFEESRGYLKTDYLRGVMQPGDFLRDGSFVYFRAQVAKFSVDDIMRMEISDGVDPAPFREIVDYAWVSVEAVLSSDDAYVVDDSGRRIQVRQRLKSRLVRARAAGWL